MLKASKIGNRKNSILVVDDSAMDLSLLTEILTERGHIVHAANSGERALQLLETIRLDLILLDIAMPDMDGCEVCERLKANPRTRDIPVIFISETNETSDTVKALATGGVDYLTKPIDAETALTRINTRLSLQNLQARIEKKTTQRTHELIEANAQLKKEIADRNLAEAALRKSKQDYEALVESIDGIVWEVDVKSFAFTFVSKKAERLLGYPLTEWYETPNAWTKYLHPEDYEATLNFCLTETKACRGHDFEYRMIAADGRIVWLRDIVTVISENGIPVTIRGVMVDITASKHAEEKIHYMAHHDELTKLPNRVLLKDRITQAIVQAHQRQNQLAVLFIDLDYFKTINDSLGHEVGDQLLQMAAIRLQNCLRKEDSIARLGGDEFVLTIAALSDSSDAALVAQKALDALNMPFFIGRRELHVSASIGISLYPADGTNVETLMRAADTAMYHAKRQGRGNYQFFTKALNKAAQQRLTMEGQLRQAFSQGEFTLYYQPQVDLESGRVISAEALLRWRKPGKDPISCNEFIAVAEETSLILPLGEWALRQACEHLKHWRDVGHAHLRLAINISARQFSQPSFHEIVAGILEKYRVPADAMDLEITESMLMQPSEDTLSNLKRISEMGIQLSVDDFGMGYSSLAYLRRFPIDALKIDRSFVSGIGDDPNDMAIVTAIISMAQSLHLKIIAEGVETLQQIKFLKSQGCLVGQGFYYGQPMSMESFTALLAEQATAYSIRVADR